VQDGFGNLFVATDVGVVATADEGVNWSVLGENLPSVVVTDLHIHEGSQFLFAATFGRSTYKIDISNDILTQDETVFSSEVKVYPNPASEMVTISNASNSEKSSVSIYDVMGRVVKQLDFKGKELQLSVENFQPGIYYLKISEGKKQTTKKLIVK
jgi:hypothetical protein